MKKTARPDQVKPMQLKVSCPDFRVRVQPMHVTLLGRLQSIYFTYSGIAWERVQQVPLPLPQPLPLPLPLPLTLTLLLTLLLPLTLTLTLTLPLTRSTRAPASPTISPRRCGTSSRRWGCLRCSCS